MSNTSSEFADRTWNQEEFEQEFIPRVRILCYCVVLRKDNGKIGMLRFDAQSGQYCDWTDDQDRMLTLLRTARRAELDCMPGNREIIEKLYGPVWNTEELRRDFEVMGFLDPYVVVRRRSDGAVGSLEFTGNPRLYFNWKQDPVAK